MARLGPWLLALALCLYPSGVARAESGEPGAPGPLPSVVAPGPPGASPAAEASSASTAAPELDSGPDDQLIGGIASWLLGAGAYVAFNYAAFRMNDLRSDESFDAYRAGFVTGDNVCDMAREGRQSPTPGAPSPETVADVCDEADSMEILQAVFAPTSVALGVLSLILILTSDTVSGPEDEEAKESAWTLQVQTAKEGGGLGLSVRF